MCLEQSLVQDFLSSIPKAWLLGISKMLSMLKVFSPVWLDGTCTSPNPLVFLTLTVVLCLVLWSLVLCINNLEFKDSGSLHEDFWKLSLHVLSSLEFCSTNSSYLNLSECRLLSRLSKSITVCLGSPSLCHSIESVPPPRLLQAGSRFCESTYHFPFPSLWDHSPILPAYFSMSENNCSNPIF